MDNFFITGLPRSRTAWLANFLTQGTSYCFHEALKYAHPKDWKALFLGMLYPTVGNSDSGLPFFVDEVVQLFPKSPIVIIERDPKACLAGINRLFPESTANQRVIDRTLEGLERLKQIANVHVFPFEKLDDLDTCVKIQNICIPFEPFRVSRWKMLHGLTVEIKKEKYPRTLPKDVMEEMQRKIWADDLNQSSHASVMPRSSEGLVALS